MEFIWKLRGRGYYYIVIEKGFGKCYLWYNTGDLVRSRFIFIREVGVNDVLFKFRPRF